MVGQSSYFLIFLLSHHWEQLVLFFGFYLSSVGNLNVIVSIIVSIGLMYAIFFSQRLCLSLKVSKKLLLSLNDMPILLKIFCVIIVLASVGPTTHADSIDYHVGHPFRLFFYKEFFTDNSLSWGVLGVGDWANYFLLSEGSEWLIRSIVAFSLIPLVGFLYERGTSKWTLLLVITPPVIIQWVTVGKPMMLYDSVIAVSLLYFLLKEFCLLKVFFSDIHIKPII